MDFREYIKNKIIIGLAPMDGYTDEAFRLVQLNIAKPDVFFTEFVSAEGLSRGGIKLYDTLLYSSEEHPIVGQLFGKDPESFYKSAVILCHLGFDGVDINMGCPAKTVTMHGSGAALISKPELATNIIKAVKSGIDDWFNQKISIDELKLNKKTLEILKRNLKYSGNPSKTYAKPTLSIKTRIGIDISMVDTWIPHLLKEHPDFITLHGRTLKQGYSGSADWIEINKASKITHNSGTLIWGNGDVKSYQQGLDYCQKYQLNGVLIGRTALGNPWVFIDTIPDLQTKFNTMIMHAHYFERVYPNRKFDSLRKNFLLYATGHHRAKQLRNQLINISNTQDLYALEDEFLS